ncbi:MAG: hypothetical protein O3A92_06770 [Verrucomicrobia bacterium]|nr:hypothetical protein [Verrucomicrobiota bacterium]
MTKSDLLPRILEILEDQHRVMLHALKETRENASGDETKSEGKYDTRATEAAYLAGAQQQQSDKLAEAIHTFRSWKPPHFELTDEIALGALVETDLDDETSFYLLAPAGGGTTLDYLGCELTLLTPEAPLFQKLAGRKPGDMLDNPPLLLLGIE